MSISGNTSIVGNASVSGNTTLNGVININGNTVFTNETTQINSKTLIGLSGGIIDICGSSAVNICGGVINIASGTTNITGNISVVGNASLTGNTSLNGVFNISGNSVFTNDTTQINSKTLIGLSGGIIDICGSSAVNICGGSMNIRGETNINGNSSVSGNLVVSGNTIFNTSPIFNNIGTDTTTTQLYINNSGLITKGELPAQVSVPLTLSVNQSVYGKTMKKDSKQFNNLNDTLIKSSQVVSNINSAVSSQQTYTFGPSIPNRWVAVGNGTNSIAYSNDGITWTGVTLKNIFSTIGFGVAWNGIMWVAVGQGTHSIAYSYDGITWTGLGTSIFSTRGTGVAWNGKMWVAVG